MHHEKNPLEVNSNVLTQGLWHFFDLFANGITLLSCTANSLFVKMQDYVLCPIVKVWSANHRRGCEYCNFGLGSFLTFLKGSLSAAAAPPVLAR